MCPQSFESSEDAPVRMDPALEAAVRTLVPLNRLSRRQREKLLGNARILELRPGTVLYAQGRKDPFAHYLLEGVLECLWNGELLTTVHGGQEAARHPLDRPGAKRHTVRARQGSTILRLLRAELEREAPGGLGEAGPASAEELEVSDIELDTSDDAMVRMLQSGLFAALPASNIQEIFARMEAVEVHAGDVVVRQEQPGDYYYIIAAGRAGISRAAAPGRTEIRLVELGPGDAFGEESLITGRPRNATVTMLTDGRLVRLGRQDFERYIRDALVELLPYGAARAQVRAGARWLDIRFPEQFATATLPGAINVPLTVLRLQCRRLSKDTRYIVCSNSPGISALGAFLLAERGFRAVALADAMSAVMPRASPLPRAPAAEAPRATPPIPEETATERDMNDEKTTDTPPSAEDLRPADPPEPAASGEGDAPADEPLEIHWEDGGRPAESEAPIPSELYDQTITGQKLAALISEIHKEHEQIEVEPETRGETPAPAAGEAQEAVPLEKQIESVVAAGGSELEEVFRDAAQAAASEAPAPEPAAAAPGTGGDELARIFRDLESRVRAHLDARLRSREAELQSQLATRIANMKRVATEHMHRNAETVRETCRVEYEKKERDLKERYARLMALANRISRQKADINQARRQLESKLEAADRLHRELAQLGQVVSDQIGDLEGMVGDGGDGLEPGEEPGA